MPKHPGAAIVVFGEESMLPLFACSIEQVRCDDASFNQLLIDISAIALSEGESHRLKVWPKGTVAGDGDGDMTVTVGDDLSLAGHLAPIGNAIARVLESQCTDLLSALHELNPRLLVQLVSDQWTESLCLRMLNVFGMLHRQYMPDGELLVRAIERDWQKVVSRLADAGVALEAPLHDGSYPVHHVARHGRAGILRFMLARGVDAKVKDRDGKSPYQHSDWAGGEAGRETRQLLFEIEWPAHTARMRKLDELTRPD